MATNRRIDFTAMEKLGGRDEVLSFMEVGSIKRLFGIREEAYHDLTLEFLCTLKVEPPNFQNEMPTSITFHINKNWCIMSMEEFYLLIELYTVPEIRDPFFKNLIYMLLTLSPTEPYGSSGAMMIKSTRPPNLKPRLHSIAMRYLHKVMVHSILSRGQSEGNLQKWDFLYVACMFEGQAMHLGHDILFYLMSQVSLLVTSKFIGCGPYVTRLVQNMDIWGDLPPMIPSGALKPVGLSTLNRMKLRTVRDLPKDEKANEDDEEADAKDIAEDYDTEGPTPSSPAREARPPPAQLSRLAPCARPAARATCAPEPLEHRYFNPRINQLIQRVDLIAFNQRMIMERMGIPYHSSLPQPSDMPGPSHPPPDVDFPPDL